MVFLKESAFAAKASHPGVLIRNSSRAIAYLYPAGIRTSI